MYQKIKNNQNELTNLNGDTCEQVILNIGISENYDIYFTGSEESSNFDSKDYLLTLRMLQDMNPELSYFINFELTNTNLEILKKVTSNDSLRQKFINNFVEFLRNNYFSSVQFTNYLNGYDNIVQVIQNDLQTALRDINNHLPIPAKPEKPLNNNGKFFIWFININLFWNLSSIFEF